MASNKPKKAEVKEEAIDKLKLAKEVLEARKVKEAVKQKGIYGTMGSFEIVRK